MNSHTLNSPNKLSIRNNPVLIIIKKLKGLSWCFEFFLNLLINSFNKWACYRILVIIIKRDSIISLHHLIDFRRLVHIRQCNRIFYVFKKMFDFDKWNVIRIFKRLYFLKNQIKIFFWELFSDLIRLLNESCSGTQPILFILRI